MWSVKHRKILYEGIWKTIYIGETTRLKSSKGLGLRSCLTDLSDFSDKNELLLRSKRWMGRFYVSVLPENF